MANSLMLLVLLLSLLTPGAAVLQGQELPTTTAVELCDLRVSDAVAQANATFTMAFSAIRSVDGSLKEVKKVRGVFLDAAPFLACVSGWKVPGPASEVVMVEFDWVHAEGWSTIRVLSKSSVLKIKIAPRAASPYGRSSGEGKQ